MGRKVRLSCSKKNRYKVETDGKLKQYLSPLARPPAHFTAQNACLFVILQTTWYRIRTRYIHSVHRYEYTSNNGVRREEGVKAWTSKKK